MKGLVVQFKFAVMSLVLSLAISGCQNTQNNSKIIAGAFNASTNIQKKFIERHAPENIKVTRNIQYMETPSLHFDLYQPENIAELAKRPVVVWIHGGGWISGSKEHASGYFKRLAEQGYNIISVEYQVAPTEIYPQQLLQIDQALEFIKQHANKYHIDASQIYLAGDSAGANMASHYAALVANSQFAHDSSLYPKTSIEQLKGLILHCGIYDLESFINNSSSEMKLLEWGITNLVQAYTGGKKDDAKFLADISPSQHLTANYPPVFISGGNKDFLTESQSVPFVQALKEKNIPVTDVFYPNSKELLVHEYQFMMSKKASQETFIKTIEFLKRTSD